MADQQNEFLLKQYEALRREIDEKLKAQDSMALYGVLGTAGFWTWYLAHQNDSDVWISCLVPAAASLAFLFKASALRKTIIIIGQHLAKTEKELLKNKDLGWEIFCENGGKRRHHALGSWNGGFWMSIFLLNALASLLFAWRNWPQFKSFVHSGF